ncbi:MAG: signal peptidase I [Candidatus Muiribacteriota bacterium]
MFQMLLNPTKFLRKHFYNFFYRMFSSFESREKMSRFCADNLETLLIAFLLAMFIRSYIIATFLIPTGSMENTLNVGDRLIGTRFDFLFREPKIGEMVIFVYPVDPRIRLIKRLIAKGGDKVEIRDGTLYLNDEPVEEPYLKERMRGRFGPVTVPENHYFFMGDNRNNSKDSRSWNIEIHEMVPGYWEDEDKVGFLHEDYIESRAILRFWPLNRFGVVQ